MLRLIPSNHMVRFVQELSTNRSLKLHAGKDTSKTYTIKNGVPQGSVLAPILNIYTSDFPHIASTQYIYADDIALVDSGLNYADIQQTLTNDLICLDLDIQRWRLRLNVNKTVSNCFHLTNCLANHQMEVRCGEKTIPTTANPKYLGITFDRSLTYSKHQNTYPSSRRKSTHGATYFDDWPAQNGKHTLTFLKNEQSHLLLLRPSIVRQCDVAVPTHTDLTQH